MGAVRCESGQCAKVRANPDRSVDMWSTRRPGEVTHLDADELPVNAEVLALLGGQPITKEKPPTMSTDQQHPAGLYSKFHVERWDGRDKPGGDKADARYFVLDYTHDPYARRALAAYGEACAADLPELARDLRSELAAATYLAGFERALRARTVDATDELPEADRG